MFGWRPDRKKDATPAQERAALADADLVLAARRGDKKAFVEIVARHQAMVCGVALGILGDFATSEDAAQEAFLTAWRKLHDLREPQRLRAWLAQIARNAALGHVRRQRGHQSLDETIDVADASLTPDEAAANEDEAELVRESLARLPETYRLPLVLFYREGQSISAVAETLDISEDAVKQRLSRGREMLRDRMSGLIETVLTRSGPTPVFTMTIAVAIGALAAPSAIAAAAFTATAATAASTTSPLLTAMSTTKTCLITATVVAVACVPIGYHAHTNQPRVDSGVAVSTGTGASANGAKTNQPPSFENSLLFAEWRRLHETHGSTPEGMPAIYKEIAEMKDPFRRRAFRAALIAEWVQLDPANGLKFFATRPNESSQRRQFFEEWLGVDARAAVDGLMNTGTGWESIARSSLVEIAKKVPARVPEIVSRLPKPESFWDTKVTDAFATLAENGLASARTAAEAITGPNREQALAGIARAWAKSDFTGAINWAKSLPEGVDRNEIIRVALIGKASSDPIAALNNLGIVPPGGRDGYFATTTGARVLSAAAKADYDSTVTWIAEHPGRVGHEDMMGFAQAVTDRLNADPIAFLNRHAADGSLKALMPAIGSAILNDSSGQRAAIWEWLKTQPENDSTATLRREVMSSAGYQDPQLALKLVNDVPRTAEGDQQIHSLAMSLWNGGQKLSRYDQLIDQAPARIRDELIKTAFQFLPNSSSREGGFDAQTWIGRLQQLPEKERPLAAINIARVWASQSPEAAINWVNTIPAGNGRSDAVAAIASSWAGTEPAGAATWVASLPAGQERDASAAALAKAMADRYPQQAWEWALSVNGPQRDQALTHVASKVGARDPSGARQWIENAPLSPEFKASLREAIERKPTRIEP